MLSKNEQGETTTRLEGMGTPCNEADLAPFGYTRQQYLGRGQYAVVSVVADSAGLHVAKTVLLGGLGEEDRKLALQEAPRPLGGLLRFFL